ncbi:MAG: tripartite tricarboxylate transporter permease, partial [Corynebacterium sp.]|nr:tripartite tricarboxylate transporter permease [Corynebacterium sp.]
LVLLVLGWFGTSFWVKLIESVPPRLLWPSVIVLAVVGSYAMRSSVFDVLVMFLAAILGYIMVKGGYPLAPLIIGVILGPIAESGFRRAMIINNGSFTWMLEPIPLVLGILTIASIAFAIWQAVRRPKLIEQAGLADGGTGSAEDEAEAQAEAAENDTTSATATASPISPTSPTDPQEGPR